MNRKIVSIVIIILFLLNIVVAMQNINNGIQNTSNNVNNNINNQQSNNEIDIFDSTIAIYGTQTFNEYGYNIPKVWDKLSSQFSTLNTTIDINNLKAWNKYNNAWQYSVTSEMLETDSRVKDNFNTGGQSFWQKNIYIKNSRYIISQQHITFSTYPYYSNIYYVNGMEVHWFSSGSTFYVTGAKIDMIYNDLVGFKYYTGDNNWGFSYFDYYIGDYLPYGWQSNYMDNIERVDLKYSISAVMGSTQSTTSCLGVWTDPISGGYGDNYFIGENPYKIRGGALVQVWDLDSSYTIETKTGQINLYSRENGILDKRMNFDYIRANDGYMGVVLMSQGWGSTIYTNIDYLILEVTFANPQYNVASSSSNPNNFDTINVMNGWSITQMGMVNGGQDGTRFVNGSYGVKTFPPQFDHGDAINDKLMLSSNGNTINNFGTKEIKNDIFITKGIVPAINGSLKYVQAMVDLLRYSGSSSNTFGMKIGVLNQNNGIWYNSSIYTASAWGEVELAVPFNCFISRIGIWLLELTASDNGNITCLVDWIRLVGESDRYVACVSQASTYNFQTGSNAIEIHYDGGGRVDVVTSMMSFTMLHYTSSINISFNYNSIFTRVAEGNVSASAVYMNVTVDVFENSILQYTGYIQNPPTNSTILYFPLTNTFQYRFRIGLSGKGNVGEYKMTVNVNNWVFYDTIQCGEADLRVNGVIIPSTGLGQGSVFLPFMKSRAINFTTGIDWRTLQPIQVISDIIITGRFGMVDNMTLIDEYTMGYYITNPVSKGLVNPEIFINNEMTFYKLYMTCSNAMGGGTVDWTEVTSGVNFNSGTEVLHILSSGMAVVVRPQPQNNFTYGSVLQLKVITQQPMYREALHQNVYGWDGNTNINISAFRDVYYQNLHGSFERLLQAKNSVDNTKYNINKTTIEFGGFPIVNKSSSNVNINGYYNYSNTLEGNNSLYWNTPMGYGQYNNALWNVTGVNMSVSNLRYNQSQVNSSITQNDGQLDVLGSLNETKFLTSGYKSKNITISNSIIQLNNTGEYVGTYSFTSDTVGGSPSGWTIIQQSPYTTVSVVAVEDGHAKVVKLYDSRGDDSYYVDMNQNFGNQSNGELSFWFKEVDVMQNFVFNIVGDRYVLGSTYETTAIQLRVYNNYFDRYNDEASVWSHVVQVKTNTWMHVRITFETGYTGGSYDGLGYHSYNVYINKTKFGSYHLINYYKSAYTYWINIHKIDFTSYPYVTVTTAFIDAIDYSWSTNWYLYRNYNITLLKNGYYTSKIYDLGESKGLYNVNYIKLDFGRVKPYNTNITIQYRFGNSTAWSSWTQKRNENIILINKTGGSYFQFNLNFTVVNIFGGVVPSCDYVNVTYMINKIVTNIVNNQFNETGSNTDLYINPIGSTTNNLELGKQYNGNWTFDTLNGVNTFHSGTGYVSIANSVGNHYNVMKVSTGKYDYSGIDATASASILFNPMYLHWNNITGFILENTFDQSGDTKVNVSVNGGIVQLYYNTTINQYDVHGYYISKAYSLGDAEINHYVKLKYNNLTSGIGTLATIQYRLSYNALDWTAWSSGSVLNKTINSDEDQYQYFQFMVNLTTSSTFDTTPVINWVNLTYQLCNSYMDYDHHYAGTIEFWLRSSNTSALTYIIYANAYGGNSGNGIVLGIVKGYFVYFGNNESFPNLPHIQVANKNQWYHIRIYFNVIVGYWWLWINGILKGEFDYNGNPTPYGLDQFAIGVDYEGLNVDPSWIGCTDSYLDALDMNWTSGYYLNRNMAKSNYYGSSGYFQSEIIDLKNMTISNFNNKGIGSNISIKSVDYLQYEYYSLSYKVKKSGANNITFSYRESSDSYIWSDWKIITSVLTNGISIVIIDISFNVNSSYGRYLQYQINATTGNLLLTPYIYSINISIGMRGNGQTIEDNTKINVAYDGSVVYIGSDFYYTNTLGSYVGTQQIGNGDFYSLAYGFAPLYTQVQLKINTGMNYSKLNYNYFSNPELFNAYIHLNWKGVIKGVGETTWWGANITAWNWGSSSWILLYTNLSIPNWMNVYYNVSILSNRGIFNDNGTVLLGLCGGVVYYSGAGAYDSFIDVDYCSINVPINVSVNVDYALKYSDNNVILLSRKFNVQEDIGNTTIKTIDNGLKDDWNTGGIAYNNPNLYMGMISTTIYDGFIRFNTTLPINNTISSKVILQANIYFYSLGMFLNGGDGIFNLRIYGILEPNCRDYDSGNVRVLTKHYVDWSINNFAHGKWVKTPDLSSIIQEIINNNTYTGSYIGFEILHNDAVNEAFPPYSGDASVGYKPVLNVTYAEDKRAGVINYALKYNIQNIVYYNKILNITINTKGYYFMYDGKTSNNIISDQLYQVKVSIDIWNYNISNWEKLVIFNETNYLQQKTINAVNLTKYMLIRSVNSAEMAFRIYGFSINKSLSNMNTLNYKVSLDQLAVSVNMNTTFMANEVKFKINNTIMVGNSFTYGKIFPMKSSVKINTLYLIMNTNFSRVLFDVKLNISMSWKEKIVFYVFTDTILFMYQHGSSVLNGTMNVILTKINVTDISSLNEINKVYLGLSNILVTTGYNDFTNFKNNQRNGSIVVSDALRYANVTSQLFSGQNWSLYLNMNYYFETNIVMFNITSDLGSSMFRILYVTTLTYTFIPYVNGTTFVNIKVSVNDQNLLYNLHTITIFWLFKNITKLNNAVEYMYVHSGIDVTISKFILGNILLNINQLKVLVNYTIQNPSNLVFYGMNKMVDILSLHKELQNNSNVYVEAYKKNDGVALYPRRDILSTTFNFHEYVYYKYEQTFVTQLNTGSRSKWWINITGVEALNLLINNRNWSYQIGIGDNGFNVLYFDYYVYDYNYTRCDIIDRMIPFKEEMQVTYDSKEKFTMNWWLYSNDSLLNQYQSLTNYYANVYYSINLTKLKVTNWQQQEYFLYWMNPNNGNLIDMTKNVSLSIVSWNKMLYMQLPKVYANRTLSEYILVGQTPIVITDITALYDTANYFKLQIQLKSNIINFSRLINQSIILNNYVSNYYQLNYSLWKFNGMSGIYGQFYNYSIKQQFGNIFNMTLLNIKLTDNFSDNKFILNGTTIAELRKYVNITSVIQISQIVRRGDTILYLGVIDFSHYKVGNFWRMNVSSKWTVLYVSYGNSTIGFSKSGFSRIVNEIEWNVVVNSKTNNTGSLYFIYSPFISSYDSIFDSPTEGRVETNITVDRIVYHFIYEMTVKLNRYAYNPATNTLKFTVGLNINNTGIVDVTSLVNWSFNQKSFTFTIYNLTLQNGDVQIIYDVVTEPIVFIQLWAKPIMIFLIVGLIGFLVFIKRKAIVSKIREVREKGEGKSTGEFLKEIVTGGKKPIIKEEQIEKLEQIPEKLKVIPEKVVQIPEKAMTFAGKLKGAIGLGLKSKKQEKEERRE